MEIIDSNQSMDKHMSRVTEAIHKINSEEKLNEVDIRELFKSLMNSHIFISDQNEKIEKKINISNKNINKKIERLESFLFID